MGGKGGNCIYTGMLTPNGWIILVVLYEDSGEHSGGPGRSSTCTPSERRGPRNGFTFLR